MKRVMAVLAVVLVWVARMDAAPLADRVPADAIVYIGWEGSEPMAARYGQTRLKAFIDASNLPALINDFLPRLIDRIAADQPRDAENLRRLLAAITPVLKYPTALYFAGIETPAAGGPPRPKLAIMCAAGKDADALMPMLNGLVAGIGPAPFPVKAFRAGDIVGIAVGYDQEQAAVAGPEPGRPKALATASDNFRQTAARVGKDPSIMLYVDIEGAVRLADQILSLAPDPQAQQMWPRVRDALGLNGLKRLAITGGFDGRDWSMQAFVCAPAPRTGLAAMIDARPLSEQVFAAIPSSATSAGAWRLSLGRLLAEVRSGLGKVDPNLQAAFDGGMAQVNGALGMDLQKDLLEALGDEWAFYIDPNNTGNSVLGMVVINRLAKPEAAQNALLQLQKTIQTLAAPALAHDKMQLRFDRVEHGGTVINYAALPMAAPAWAVKDGVLYAGLYPQVVAGAIDGAAARGASLLDNADFQALRKRLGGQNCTGFSFTDLPRSAGDGYPMALLLVQLIGFADMAGVKTPPMILPPLSRLRPLLIPAGGVSWVDDEGWHFRSVSPFPCAELLASPGGMMGVQGLALATAMLLPAMSTARERAQQAACANNLRQIAMAAIMYANDNKGQYPPDLAALAQYDLTVRVFACPSRKRADLPDKADPKAVAEWIRRNSDYVYIGAGLRESVRNPESTIIAHDKPGNHGKRGVNAAFADGHVEWMDMKRFEQAMARQKARAGQGN